MFNRPETSEESLQKLKELARCAKNHVDNPCLTKKDDKSCADQGLNADQFCLNCLNSWTETAAIINQTPQEALDLSRGLQEKRKAKKEREAYLLSLMNLPCEKELKGSNCGDQDLMFTDMCPTCKKFWIEASSDNNQTPDEAIQFAKSLRNMILKGQYGSGPVN